jgi:hypothetical protein
MKAEIAKEYREKLRDFVARKGRKVNFEKRWGFEEDDEVSIYGWVDYDAEAHLQGRDRKGERTLPPCSWVVPEGAELYERTYSMFTDTFSDNEQEVGINVKGCRCACGKYADVTLRYKGSLTEVLADILGLPEQTRFTL